MGPMATPRGPREVPAGGGVVRTPVGVTRCGLSLEVPLQLGPPLILGVRAAESSWVGVALNSGFLTPRPVGSVPTPGAGVIAVFNGTDLTATTWQFSLFPGAGTWAPHI